MNLRPERPQARVHVADVKDGTESGGSLPQTNVRNAFQHEIAGKSNKSSSSCGSKHSSKQDLLSKASFRQLQANMEAENQQMQEKIQALLDTENGFMKELEYFLSQREVTELRRKELLHKHWTEHVWFPLQKRVEDHVSRRRPMETKRRLGLYNDYLRHCNSKGFVFLDTYNLQEYNPFLLRIKKPHYVKLKTGDTKERFSLHLHERLKEKRTLRSCESGCKNTRKKVQELPENHHPLSKSVVSQAEKRPQASADLSVSASMKIPAAHETELKDSGRLDTRPRYISATATSDGRSHQTTSCWFSRYGCGQQTSVYTN